LTDALSTANEGTVRRVAPGRAIVFVDGEPIEAHVRGGLKEGRRVSVHLLAVGDRVRLRPSGDQLLLVEEVLPRRNELARVDVGDRQGRRKHVLAANLDRVTVVVSLDLPRFNARGVDRFLVMAAAAGIPSLLVVNKCDLHDGGDPEVPSPREIQQRYEDLGYEVIATSATAGLGLEQLRAALSGRLTFLLGPSGAGKSTLLNAAYGLNLRAQAISGATSKGVHTTTRVDWIDLPGGGAVLDAPGIRAIHPWGLEKGSLDGCFPEFGRADRCRFGNCLHVGEAGCGVEAAVAAGWVLAERLESYRRILESLAR
jgi:ribosome biogenesis GTPase